MEAVCKTDTCKSKATYGFKFAQPEYCIKHGRLAGASTQYGICKCGKSTPRFALKDERASSCAQCKTKDMVNICDRRCECKKHLPTYGFPTETRPEFCSECKKDGMINLKDKNKKCVCGKVIPSFGYPTDKKPSCCKQCKKDDMISLLNAKCPCGKSAAFGFKGDATPSYCLSCKKDGMENIVTKKCKCGKAIPVFGKKTDKRATCCMACKSEGMINIGNRKCKCGKAQPTQGFKTDTGATCCVSCKEPGMSNISDKKCKCGKTVPVFGLKGDKRATCCVSCKTKEMVNIKAKMCTCGKSQPRFGFKGDTRATCCVQCKKDGMTDIVSPKCKGLVNFQGKAMECPFDHRAKQKYSMYCTKCFEQNFPDDPRTCMIRARSHENAVRDFLAANYEDPSFIHNTSLWTGQAECTCRRRIDFRALIGNTLLCIEVDENQHAYRDAEDEELRYNDLMMLHGGKFVFIRFNPDLYIDEEGLRKNPTMESRLLVLKDAIDEQIERIEEEDNEELVEILYLFYDDV